LKLKISEELECAFDVVGKILMSQDLMEFILVRFIWIQNVGRY
jgi:hypothetical protein